MADVEQWVNLTVNRKWRGEGIADVKQMGLWVNVRFEMAQKRRATIFVTKEADGGNAAYSAPEQKRRAGFQPRVFSRRRYRTDRNGVRIVRTTLTLAGGDKFKFEAEDRGGNKVPADTFLTRRKLYYQIIPMAGAPLPGTGTFENEFWSTGDNLYIKMVEFSPGSTIPSRINLDDTVPSVFNAVKRQARRRYSRDKKPYAFATLVVRKNCIHGWETGALGGVSFAGPYVLSTQSVLMDIADPADDWYGSIVWQDNVGGAPLPLAKTRCARHGDYDVEIDTTGIPQGVPGTLTFRLKIIEIIGMGVSFPTDNLTLVATESYDGSVVSMADVESVINHEVGHKCGMVPGPQGTRALDQQATYYDGRGHSGGHCYHGTLLVPTFVPPPGGPPIVPAPTPDCTMFGDTRTQTGVFCGVCRTSLRKLDLRSRTNAGIRTQF